MLKILITARYSRQLSSLNQTLKRCCTVANHFTNGTAKGKTLCFRFVRLFCVCFAKGALQLEITTVSSVNND